MGLLYRIYQSVQEGQEREGAEADDVGGQESGPAAVDVPVSLLQLLSRPIGGAGDQDE
ncbi:hypothetical protein [Cohnella hongkongensis]|uniref:Uncharacterized protein n=1 Tax=Cohnella hongkongensis TaxID=178337 RepID=A0ABV9F7X4_9BACL